MGDGFYTLIVVPHAKAKFRKIQIPVRVLRWAVGGTVVLAIAFSLGLVHVTRMSWEVYSLRRLRTENAALRAKTKAYEEKQTSMAEKLRTLESVVNKLGVMAGLDTVLPDSAVGGVGGVSNGATQLPSLESAVSLGQVEKTLSDLQERSERLESFYADQKVLLASTPSIWPVRGYLSCGFGNRLDPFTGQKDFHPGIDISTPLGTKVVAPADGIVVSMGPRGGYGNSIIIDHGFGIQTRYAHLDGFNVKVGQRVHRGDVIGFVGNTGRSTAPHLHYEVWVRNQAQNPIHYILDEFRSFG
jgi:murein DD-endopeptidase MepM/ murein hydrolase activator NlpD